MSKPSILKQKYPLGDVVVIAADIRQFAEDLSSLPDAAPAIQAAIDETAAAGGGVVYLPEGHYALRTPLIVKTAVTLRGEWISPEKESPSPEKGTVLDCYWGREDPNGQAQVTLRACSGIQCVTFYYPEQSFAHAVSYSPTVRQDGVDSVTLENVTMINPWRGMQCGSDANELHYLHNVYMTPMHEGLFMNLTTDIGRMYHFYIAPDYYAAYVAGTDLGALRRYMLQNVTGVFMARSDWEYGYDIHIQYCKVGFLVTSLTDSAPNAQLSSLHLYNCDIGFQVFELNAFGIALSDSTISCDIPGLTAAVCSIERFRTVMQFSAIDFSGPYPHLIRHSGPGQFTFANCTFDGATQAAILQETGGLTILQCKFSPCLPSAKHIVLSDSISAAQLVGNDFSGEPALVIPEKAQENFQMHAETVALRTPPRGGHKPFGGCIYPDSERLFDVTDYGAIADGETDCTAAFTGALREAGNGGGIVYVPAGRYRIDGHLHIPSHVQLRGIFQVPCHTMGGGSVLMTYANKGDENAAPFITAAPGSGVFGIVIYHPEQDAAHPIEYPWAFQALGPDCYAVNTVFVNPWLGADFGTYPSDRHFISYISGAPIRCGIFCGNNSGDGWVENIQFNPHYFFRTELPNKPTRWQEFWHNQLRYLDALKFGYNKEEHLLCTFVFAAHRGLCFVLQDGKGTSGTFIGHGTDSGQTALYNAGCGHVDLVNTELVTIEAPRDRVYFHSVSGAEGQMNVFNSLLWGAPQRAIVINGGDLEFQLTNIVDMGAVAVTVTGGSATFAGTFFRKCDNHVSVHSGRCRLVCNMTVRRYGKTQRDGTPGALLPREPALDLFRSEGVLEELCSFSK